MTYDELETIGLCLFGTTWKSQFTKAFNIDARRPNDWKRQGVPKWVYEALVPLIESQEKKIKEAKNLYKKIKPINDDSTNS